ncbi:MAG: hypothetical protein M3305_04455 [Actinomycetota bacterium]|nr:hypothetical protein [Actinomycetota bacterium]
MADYKYPRTIEFLDELPNTAAGKFLRRELREGTQKAAPVETRNRYRPLTSSFEQSSSGI